MNMSCQNEYIHLDVHPVQNKMWISCHGNDNNNGNQIILVFAHFKY